MKKSAGGKKGPGCITIIFVIVVLMIIIGTTQKRKEERMLAEQYTSNDYALSESLSEEEDYELSYEQEDYEPTYEEDPSVPQENSKPNHSQQDSSQEKVSKGLSKDQLIEDIYLCNSVLNEAGLRINSIDITNRDSDEGMETLWITYVAEDDDSVYYGEICFVYSYDEGFWRLDVVEHGSNYYEAKNACDESLPLRYVGDIYEGANAEVTVMERNRTDVNEEIFDIFATWRENEVVMNTDEHVVTVRFDLIDGWRVVDVDQSRYKETWDVCGRYTLNNDKLSAVVDIHEFDIDSQRNTYTLTYSYSFVSHQPNDDLFGGPTMMQGQKYSSGPITVTESRGAENEYVSLNVDKLVRMYICGRNINWDPIGGGYGVWVKVLSNYAETYGEFWLHK